MRFTKMEGIGNDYLYINGFEEKIEDPAELSVRMSRYHFGCGSDGLILILPSQQADFRMRMFNNDGSESEMCGNGIRCVAKYCHDRGLTDKTLLTVETGAGVKTLRLNVVNGQTESVEVDMGQPELDGLRIPTTVPGNPVIGYPVEVNGRTYPLTMVSMGNPHGVTFVEDPSTAPVTIDGPALEVAPLFPRKANIEFVHVVDRTHVTMRVWERGTGETLACGTGACAVLTACVLNGLTEREAEITLPGGKLTIRWDEKDRHIYMTGPAVFVYDGQWLQD
ncbi:MAG: diaminopimelate epimerase [Eubacteriales bacterium]|nr:diaminopimelate epimerase [Eubacteriales bacterium]